MGSTVLPPAKKMANSDISQIKMDDTAKEFIEHCKKTLSRYVGPMGRVFVKEAVCATAQNKTFSIQDFPRVIEKVAKSIENPDDRNAFLAEMRQIR